LLRQPELLEQHQPPILLKKQAAECFADPSSEELAGLQASNGIC